MATTDEHSRRITRAERLPEPLGAVYTRALQSGSPELSIYAPSLTSKSARHLPSAGYLLMIFDERVLFAIDRDEHQVEIIDVPLTDMICIEHGEVLLFSWMKFVFSRGTRREIKILFNSVGAELFTGALALIRRTLDAAPCQSSDLHGVTPEVPFKFKNALDSRLSSEERVLAIAFQPEIRERHMILYEQQVAPPLLAALTDRQFLLITEEPPVARENLGEYSEIYTYCPFSRIDSITFAPHVAKEITDMRVKLVNAGGRFTIHGAVSSHLVPQFEMLRQSTSNFIGELTL